MTPFPKETSDIYFPAGTLTTDSAVVLADETTAGCLFTSLRVVVLEPAVEVTIRTGRFESAVLPLTALDVTVLTAGESFLLQGRRSVFDRVTDFAYAPVGSVLVLRSTSGGEVAVAGAVGTGDTARPYAVDAPSVPVETRGAGRASRQVTNYLTPTTAAADRLCVVEVMTPPGNWSSYPPHKHDEASEHEAVLEELYYFRIAGPDGYGFHRTYTADRTIDATVAVRDGDVFLVPRGYHGPCAASPDHEMYYMNVLGGPGPERSMAFCDDPAHHWIRDTWATMPLDPRCPVVTAVGRTTGP